MRKAILCGYNWIGCKFLSIMKKVFQDVYVYTHESPYHINSLAKYSKKLDVGFTKNEIDEKNLPFKPDIIVSAYYRNIIDKDVISYSENGGVNLHPSLLPRYRGCSSLTWAMIKGDQYAGFTYHYMVEDVDSGRIILQKPIKIEKFDTQETLYNRVMFEAPKYLEEVIELVGNGYEGIKQEGGRSDYYHRGAPYNGEIDKKWSKEKKERFIRAMIYPPRPCARLNGEEIRRMEDMPNEK